MAIHSTLILPHGLPLRRMLIALGLSLLVHFLMVGGWGASGAARTTAVAVPLQARLEPMSAALPPLAAVDTPSATTAPQPEVSVRRAAPAMTAVAVAEQSPAGAAASGPDLRFYLARELDQYPSPLAALTLSDLSRDNGRGSARLWVSIDQTGRVVEAALIDADPPGELERQARERVLATPFVPARRDGRPVKSRILLVLGQGA
jgi:outer membrane biosynthesis protein TonB